FAFLSQLLALIRDRLLAHTFGAGKALDIYYAAFRIPDLIFVTAASIVSLSILIPFIVEVRERGKEETKRLINSIFSFFFLFIGTVSLIAFFLIPFLLPKLFPGFSPADISYLIFLSRLLLLSPIFLGFSNLLGSITQAHRQFFIYALSPLLYNLGIIGGIIFLAPLWGITGIVIGVLLGALFHFLIQVPSVFSLGLFPHPTFSLDFSSIRKIIFISLPRTFTLSVSNIEIFVLLGFASLYTAGSISVFNLSYNLQSISLSIIGVSYSLAAFPTLARLFSKGEKKEFLEHILVSARHIIFWSVPLAVLFIVLRAQIVRVVLGSGLFDWGDTRLTAAALALFTISVVFQSLELLFTRGYYSAGKTFAPFIASLTSGVITISFAFYLNFVFQTSSSFRFFVESLLRVEDLPGTVILMLPLAYSIGACFNSLLLGILFHIDFRGFSFPLIKTFFHSFAASVIMGFYAYLSLNFLGSFLDLDTFSGIFLQGLGAGIVGVSIGILVLQLLDNEEFKEVSDALHRKVPTPRLVSPETTDLL
ncbi:MAG: lipid II flippase MurJ, partial [Patescibacteria group bacterium]